MRRRAWRHPRHARTLYVLVTRDIDVWSDSIYDLRSPRCARARVRHRDTPDSGLRTSGESGVSQLCQKITKKKKMAF